MFLGVWSYVLLIKDTAVHQVILPRYQVQALQKSRNTTSTSQRKPLGQWNVRCIGWLIMIDPCTWGTCWVCLFFDLLYGNFSRLGHICNINDDNWGVSFQNVYGCCTMMIIISIKFLICFFCPCHFPVFDLLEWEGQTKTGIFHGNSWQYKWIGSTKLTFASLVVYMLIIDRMNISWYVALSRHINSKYV